MAVDQETRMPSASLGETAAAVRRTFRSPVAALLEDLYARHAELCDGAVATYIPELAAVDPDSFGIALATIDGSLYEVGDSRTSFTLQSLSKPLTYGLALERLGQSAVHARIGVEPSGDSFNSIDLAPDTGTPANAMINAGAITAAALIASAGPAAFEDVLDLYGRYAGRQLEIDEAVYRSEHRTGHRNRAIAHLLRTFDVIDGDPEDGLDLYFRQCAITVDCRDLALIGATLANGGVHPLTGDRAVAPGVVRDVLSVMTSCGMYDGAGRWLTGIGLPAKSGVSGGIVAVLPGRLAIAVFSPRLDPRGNSARGVAVCRDLSSRLNLHLVRPGERIACPIRTSRTLRQVSSKRARTSDERRVLDEIGDASLVYELQGELGFGAVELMARRLEAAGAPLDGVIVDIRRVTTVEPGGSVLLDGLRASLESAGVRFALAGTPSPEAVEQLDGVERFEELDQALEWCEERILRRAGAQGIPVRMEAGQHELLRNIPAAALARILTMLRQRRHSAGELVVAEGDPASELYLVMAGELTVIEPGKPRRRLATVSAGMTFGELGFALNGTRTADVVADTDVDLLVLDRGAFERLRDEHAPLYATLLERLLGSLARTTLRLDLEARALTR